MKKLLNLGLVLLIALSFLVGASLSLGKERKEIPEENGTYDDPDVKGVKVRVFVHKEKPARASSSSLVCASDLDSPNVVGATGWHLPSSWTYNLNPSSVPSSVGASNLPTIAGNGFSDWITASGGKVNFVPGSTTTMDRQSYDGKNIVAWGRTQGTALGVTYIRYYSLTGEVVDVDTIMNKKFSWSWANSNTCANSSSYDAENILTHELGHWIGMDDMYNSVNYQNATMYGYGSKGEVKKVTLSTGDKSGAYKIYNP